MPKRAAHALIGVKQRERHPWSGTREKQSTAREETASPLHSRAPSPESRPPQLQATAQPRRHRLWREGCSVGPRAAFPCPHPQGAARAGGRPAGPQGSHRHGRSEAWGVAEEPLPDPPGHTYLPRHPTAATDVRTQWSTVDSSLGNTLPSFSENKT